VSDIFGQWLRAVRYEYEAAREAIAYINRNWQKYDIYGEITEGLTPQHFKNAAQNLEAIFIIRLFATFEGILKEHLAKSHPHISVPEDVRAVWLIDRSANLQNPHIVTPLRNRVHDVRRYRNFLVHPGGVIANRIFFQDALASLAKFSDRLPDPL
jgi:hypothetical protein